MLLAVPDPRAQLGVNEGPLSPDELADVRVFLETGAADPIFAR